MVAMIRQANFIELRSQKTYNANKFFYKVISKVPILFKPIKS